LSITDNQLKAIAKLSEYDGPAELNDGEGLIAKISPKQTSHFNIVADLTAKKTYSYWQVSDNHSLKCKANP
jgi:hypothetical protein